MLENKKKDFISLLIIYALGEFKDTLAVDPLITILKNIDCKESDSLNPAEIIIDALVKIGKPSEQSLLNLLNDKSVSIDIQSWDAKGLAELGNSSIANPKTSEVILEVA